MALYHTNNKANATPSQTNVATTYTAAGVSLSLTAATTSGNATLRRAYIYEFDVGTDGQPNSTDCSIAWDISRQTSLGTGVSMAVNPLDPADAVTGTIAFGNFTIVPIVTATSSVWQLGANQRASYRWVVNPGGPGELVIPATNVAGFVIRALSATYASTVMTSANFRE